MTLTAAVQPDTSSSYLGSSRISPLLSREERRGRQRVVPVPEAESSRTFQDSAVGRKETVLQGLLNIALSERILLCDDLVDILSGE